MSDFKLPIDLLLLAATRAEMDPVLLKLNIRARDLRAPLAWFPSHGMAIGVSGVGAQRAADLTRRLIEQHKPARVLLVGFAGGLDPALRTGQVLAIQHVIDGRGSVIHLSGGPPMLKPDDSPRAPGQTLLSLDHVADSPQMKRTLFEQHRAAAVDMESFAVANVVAGAGLPMGIYRAISDPAHVVLPAETLNWVRPDGSADLAAVLRHLMRRPKDLPVLWRLGRDSRYASKRLAFAIQKMLAGWVNSEKDDRLF